MPFDSLSETDKARFRQACRDEGVNPREQCPLCRTRKIWTETADRFCRPHQDWETFGLRVRCPYCCVEYIVIDKDRCRAMETQPVKEAV